MVVASAFSLSMENDALTVSIRFSAKSRRTGTSVVVGHVPPDLAASQCRHEYDN